MKKKTGAVRRDSQITGYWLMKSEPEEYSFEDLENHKNGGRWDGVRNYQARNFLRDMKVGDKALFYYSSVKVPAVVGVATIVGAPYPDPTQFNPKSKYFDPKATKDRAIWVSRDLAPVDNFLRGKEGRGVTLPQMKANPKLSGMRLLARGNRLSVMPVTKAEFEEIVKMAKRKLRDPLFWD
jgi:predicted RNA-binding protein with PUA-like domain